MDIVFVNGKIVTMAHGDDAVHEAVGVRDGRVASVGSTEALSATVTAHTRVVDLRGSTVLPGLVDSHVHCFLTGLMMESARLESATCISDLCERLADSAARTEPGEWVIGTGCSPWDLTEKRFPNMQELDKAVPKHPVYVCGTTLHSGAANTHGFRLIDIDPRRDGVERDESGRPTGVFSSDDTHFEAARVACSSLSDDQIAYRIARAAELAAQRGVTTMHCLEGQFVKDDRDVMALFHAGSGLPVHTVLMYQTTDVKKVMSLGLPRIGGCLTVDGATGDHTARLYEPYADAPRRRGDLYFTEASVQAFVAEAHQAGLQIGMHAIGDEAVDIVVRAYKLALEKSPRDDARHRIEHFCLPTEWAKDQAEHLGLALPMQPVFSWLWDQPEISHYEALLGSERAERKEPFADLVGRGLHVSGGSDSPVTVIDPLAGIHSLVNNPRACRRVGVREAIRLFTANGAWTAFEESQRGSIEVGKYADLVVLDRDPFAEPDRIRDFCVEMTVCEGRVSHAAEVFRHAQTGA